MYSILLQGVAMGSIILYLYHASINLIEIVVLVYFLLFTLYIYLYIYIYIVFHLIHI